MDATTFGITDSGMNGNRVDVECHISNGLPSITIVGSVSKSVEEAKERLRGAFSNGPIEMPKKRIILNLAPGDIPKHSAGLDLAMAVAILAASKQVRTARADSMLFIGELGLDGSLRPVRGIVGKLLSASKLGIDKVMLPRDNLAQAMLVPGIVAYPATSLTEAYLHLAGGQQIQSINSVDSRTKPNISNYGSIDISDVTGQETAKRALEIAAAGGHNLLLNGPPGTGKSMLAKSLVTILPPMTQEEILEVTHLHSLANNHFDEIVSNRPFRTPHHTASNTSIIGGGQHIRPGEISLSHRGVLFLDELPEFTRPAIEALRQPLEDRTINVARASGNITFPAHFTLVATSNPCPCGYYGSERNCDCSPHEIYRYQRKLSGPIMDRIDMFVDVSEINHDQLLHSKGKESSRQIRDRVIKAQSIQIERFKVNTKYNADMHNKDIKTLAQLDADAESLLNQAAKQLQISARNYMRTIKVARTIADLDGSRPIASKHIAEALQYRRRPVSL